MTGEVVSAWLDSCPCMNIIILDPYRGAVGVQDNESYLFSRLLGPRCGLGSGQAARLRQPHHVDGVRILGSDEHVWEQTGVPGSYLQSGDDGRLLRLGNRPSLQPRR